MGILDSISHSSAPCGIRAVIAGVEKIGKTTLICSAPRTLLVPLEIGFGGVNVAKVPMLEQFDDVLALLDEISVQVQWGTFPYRTIAFDSATALERLIHDKVLQTDPGWAKGNKKAITMDSALGGYGRAYQHANEKLHEFLLRCDWLATNGGINIILTCHVFASKMVDPTAGEYDSFDLLLHSPKNNKTYGKREMITQWADLIGFVYEPIFISEGKTINKGISQNKGRVIGLSRTTSYVAGNRYGIEGEIPLPKESGWNHVANSIHQSMGLDYFNRD